MRSAEARSKEITVTGQRTTRRGAILLAAVAAGLALPHSVPPRAGAASRLAAYYAHPAVEDASGVIAPWYRGTNGQLDERARIAVDVYKRYPWVGTERAVMAAPDFIYNSHWSISAQGEIAIPPTTDWMCGDLGQRAWSIIKGLAAYYRYSGDPVAFVYIPLIADYVLDYGLTPGDHAWPRFPISTPTSGKAYGRCDPGSRIQLDLCARLGEDILTAYQLTGEPRYFEAVKHWADLFAEHCSLDPEFPPWGRYVDPSVVGWSDLLTGSTTMICQFLDAVVEAGYAGRGAALLRAREAGDDYIRNRLLPDWTVNDVWGRQYWDWDNPVTSGIVAMCADYLLERREAFPNWRNDVRNMLSLPFHRNGVDPNSRGDTYSGAWAYPESSTCCGTSLSYCQYTAAPTFLRYGALADDEWAREIGRRMILMATYDSDEAGVVKDGLTGEIIATGEWSNLAHPWPLCQVMEALAWMPDILGPRRENHIVRSASVVTAVQYGAGVIRYTTFAAPVESVDVMRLAFCPASVLADGAPLAQRGLLDANGYTVQDLGQGDCLVTVRHDGCRAVELRGADPQQWIPAHAAIRSAHWTEAAASGQDGFAGLTASQEGASLAWEFAGNRVALIGRVEPRGGLADVCLDGERLATRLDFWNPAPRSGQTLFARGGLGPGRHRLEIVAHGRGNPLSGGADLHVDGLLVSAAEAAADWGAGGGPTGPQRMIFGYTGRQDYLDSRGHSWRPASEFVVRTGYGTDSMERALWTKRRCLYIGNTADPELYRYGIHGQEFWVNLTVGHGTYYVRMLFAATPLHWFLEPDPEGGFRRYVMDVSVNGEPVLAAFDVAAHAGGRFLAHDEVVREVAPRNGIIELRFRGQGGREAVLQALEIGPMSEAPGD